MADRRGWIGSGCGAFVGTMQRFQRARFCGCPPARAFHIGKVGSYTHDAREHYEKAFKQIADKARGDHVNLTTAMSVGHPAQQIIRAETDEIDVSVFGRKTGSQIVRKMMLALCLSRSFAIPTAQLWLGTEDTKQGSVN